MMVSSDVLRGAPFTTAAGFGAPVRSTITVVVPIRERSYPIKQFYSFGTREPRTHTGRCFCFGA